MARPTKLNLKTQDRLTHALRFGLTRVAACAYAGVDYSTFTRWLKRGSESKEFWEFCNAVELSENIAAAKMETLLIEAAATNPHYALEWLKRRRRFEWSDNFGRENKLSTDILF